MKFDIKIKEIKKVKYHTKEYKLDKDITYDVPYSSKLVLEFEGKDINNIICNTIRRVIFDNIPIYAIPNNFINITENKSVFNNDMMRNRLEQLPIYDVKSDLYYLEEKYWKNVDYDNREVHPKEKIIELYLDEKNDTNNIKNITTNDLQIFEESNKIDNKYSKKCPILLIQLRPDETFKCSMKAILGVGEVNNIWGAGNCYYDDHTTDDMKGVFIENKTNRITLTVESSGQIPEYDLLDKACSYIITKIKHARDKFKEEIKPVIDNDIFVLMVDDEDHTLGQLINDVFQDHPDITFSGISKPDHFVKSIRFKIISKKKDLQKIIDEQLAMLSDKYEFIKSSIKKLKTKS